QAAVHCAAVPEAVTVEVEFPQARAGIEDADLSRSCTGPVAGYGEVSRDPEGPQAAVHGAGVHFPVAVAIQLPEARAGLEDTNLRRPYAGPVADHRAVALLAKGLQAAVHRAIVQHPVAVEVQVPSARAGAEKPDLHIHWFSEGGGNRGVGKEG